MDDFKKTIFIWYLNKKSVWLYKLVRAAKQSEKMQQVVQKESLKKANNLYDLLCI